LFILLFHNHLQIVYPKGPTKIIYNLTLFTY